MLVLPTTSPAAAVLPDIIVILADDLGYSDLGCQGGEIATPNIDRLAAEGMRFTSASNTARCCPSRASLLTGAYSHRVGHGWMTQLDQGRPAYKGDLASDCMTLPEVLKGAGYRSFMSGKWHLTSEEHSQKLPASASWPTRRGFERFFGIIGGGASYVAPNFLVRDESEVKPGPGFSLTHAITDAALEYIEAPIEGPRFIYVAYTAPHWPLHADTERVERLLATYTVGYNRISDTRIARLRRLGLLAVDQQSVGIEVPSWDTLAPDVQADQARRMAVYAAQIQDMDDGVGLILEAVSRSGRADNTLILFASDNGACAEVLEAPPLPEKLSDSLRSSYGKAWATVSSLPFRGYKKEPTQGGLATPFFVRWPKEIKPGQWSNAPVHLIDVLPTFAEITGARIPKTIDGQALTQPDGVSFRPEFSGGTMASRDLFFEHEGGRTIRRGTMKALALSGSSSWQLYDIAQDPAERHDLAAERPDELKSLKDAWHTWASANGVLPLDSRSWGARNDDPEGWKKAPD